MSADYAIYSFEEKSSGAESQGQCQKLSLGDSRRLAFKECFFLLQDSKVIPPSSCPHAVFIFSMVQSVFFFPNNQGFLLPFEEKTHLSRMCPKLNPRPVYKISKIKGLLAAPHLSPEPASCLLVSLWHLDSPGAWVSEALLTLPEVHDHLEQHFGQQSVQSGSSNELQPRCVYFKIPT